MPQGFNLQPPSAYTRLCETRVSADSEAAITPPLGEFVRVLATSRPGGVFLCLGHAAGEMATWILDGMDLSGRLVAVVEDNEEAEVLRPLFGDDLRVTVHVQDALGFLCDVRDHRFDLITDLNPGDPADLTRLALGRLALGAFYLSLHAAPELAGMLRAQAADGGHCEAPLHADRFAFAHLRSDLGISMLVHGPQRFQAKRRGGRRARQGVTPLFSTRAKRRP
jgi:hypothetical protein